MYEVVIASVIAYFVLLLGLLIACLSRRVGWRWLLTAAIPVFVAAAVACLVLLFAAQPRRGKSKGRVGWRPGGAGDPPWRW